MPEVNVLERAASIAAESLKKIQAPAIEKAAVEAKAAAEKEAKASEENKKGEGIKLAEAEARAKEDERILTLDDEKLSESELSRKTELKETKRKKDESPDEKIKRVQEASQKRIDEIKSELLSERDKTKQEMAALKAELDEIKRPKQQEDAQKDSKRLETERIAKYVDEDKTKPKEDRREMSKEDLEGWYLEDPLGATEWIQDRTLRRSEERKKIESESEKSKQLPVEAKQLADDFIAKQNESKAKLFAKYPGANPSKELIAKTKTELGLPLDRILTNDELSKINKSLGDKSEEFRLVQSIVAEEPKKYLEATNGPELVMAEIEKRLGKVSKGKIELTQEELDARVQAEIDRRKLVDGEGITSSNGGKKVDNSNKTKSELRQKQELIAKKAGISIESLDKSIKRRESIPGASSGGAEN